MTTPTLAEIFDALFVLLIPGAFLIAVTWLVERKMDAPVDRLPRIGHRIPTAERQLLGLDWRDSVRPYFQRRWESNVRTRAAVNHVCGIEPSYTTQDNGAAAVQRSAPPAKESGSNASATK